ncbi:carboxypeptidase-like regulatory domain-containing protein [Nitrosospira sp. NpAV]|uniref:carboxypeptidase-like regulatory domain-containing protein n=1 Tax=Nitrosospira sp. NpAV TaxID=58133 RepID=UPI0005A250FA|nr:carboxypeptidase-like regulatory domain-containing protein [Nitrosospira sp. NpAV]KIO48510.1 collagen-binding protein [Nitrosospira sp. NpAV]
MKIQIIIRQMAITLTCIFSTLSFAYENPSLPPVQTQGQTQFISGGIGKDESEAILQARRSWPLMLELTQAADSRAQYISDARIIIKDRLHNTVLDTTAEGPYLLVKLPAGEYSLEATYNATTLHRKLNLQKESGKKVTLVWPADKNH